jgi:hypothetical protein
MKYAANQFLRLVLLSLLSLTAFSATSHAQGRIGGIAGMSANINGQRMSYLTAGHGSTTVLLLHG